MMRFVDIVLSIPFLFIVLVLATKYSATVLDHQPAARLFLVARPGPPGPRRGADAARARLRLRRRA